MPNLRLAVSAVIASSALLACPSQQSLCKSGVDQVCERVYECQPQQVKDSAQFQAGFGTSVDECKTLLYANPLRPLQQAGIACDEVNTDAELCANTGVQGATKFDLGKAGECRDARNALTCEAYLDQLETPSMAPAACNARCS
jgi:hypothetical protein